MFAWMSRWGFLSFSFLCLYAFILMCSVAMFEVVCRVSVQGCIKLWQCLRITLFSLSLLSSSLEQKSSSDSDPFFRIQDNRVCYWRIFFQSILLLIQAFRSISHIKVVVSRTTFLMFSYMLPDSLFRIMWNIVAMSFAKQENRTACFHGVDVPNENVWSKFRALVFCSCRPDWKKKKCQNWYPS